MGRKKLPKQDEKKTVSFRIKKRNEKSIKIAVKKYLKELDK